MGERHAPLSPSRRSRPGPLSRDRPAMDCSSCREPGTDFRSTSPSAATFRPGPNVLCERAMGYERSIIAAMRGYVPGKQLA